MPLCIGFDTSNYTTSAACYDGCEGRNESRLLDVPEGTLGLRQSDALFLHTRRLPQIVDKLAADADLTQIRAVAASNRPRAVEDSYMPCFLAGVCQGKNLATILKIPYFEFSHQQGHLAAAALSAKHTELLDEPFLAWHLSGGTTELLLVEPGANAPCAKAIGGTTDLSAGQLIDRTGQALHLPFPSGRYIDVLSTKADRETAFRVKRNGLSFSLSGMENKMHDQIEKGESPENIARFTLATLAQIIEQTTAAAQKEYPGLPVLCSGGVASNSLLRERMGTAVFATPEASRDNALGIAFLAWRVLTGGKS